MSNPLASANAMNVIIAFMAISYALMFLGLKISLLETVLFGVIILPYPYRWGSTHDLASFALFNLLLFILIIDRAKPIKKLGILCALLIVAQLQHTTAPNFFLSTNLTPYIATYKF